MLLSSAILWCRDAVKLKAPNVPQDLKLITDCSRRVRTCSSSLHPRIKPYLRLHCPESNAVADMTRLSSDRPLPELEIACGERPQQLRSRRVGF